MTENFGSSLELSSVRELCRLRFEVIKSVEEIFQQNPDIGDAIFLRNSWVRWKEGNWGSYTEGKIPTKEEVEKKIEKYSLYIQENNNS